MLLLNDISQKVALKSAFSDQDIGLYLDKNYRGIGNGGFRDTLHIKTRQPASALTDEQKKILTKAAFTLESDYYLRKVEVRGIVIRRERFGKEIPDISPLNKTYQVHFFIPKKVTGIDKEGLAFNLLMTPLTLTGDIIFLVLSPLALMTGDFHK